MSIELIKIRGAKTNNLKNINLDLPREKLIVITGLSGSGKSSLAFDTIYAEGQRRYVESLSAYARQFVGLMDKPAVDLIEGLSPAIAIDQRTIGNNPRSTVGTITEIYDYLRLLFARAGTPYCPHCQLKLKKTPVNGGANNPADKSKKSDPKKYLFTCLNCDFTLNSLEPKNFSFNSSHGACQNCLGLGYTLEINPSLVWNDNLNIEQGAIKPLAKTNMSGQLAIINEIKYLADRHSFSLSAALKDLAPKYKELILQGDDKWSGLSACLLQKYQETKSSFIHQEIEKCLKTVDCPTCSGRRLRPEFLAVKFQGKNISEISTESIVNLIKTMNNWQLIKSTPNQLAIISPIIQEIIKNLSFLKMVGLDYLSLDRSAASLSGGEGQRIRLASQVGSALSGVIYVLDEPSIGLHQRDNDKLINLLKNLRDNGNTVIVVEHDEAMMQAADFLVDIGPGAGELGGEVLFAGQASDIVNCPQSLTGAYLSKKLIIPTREKFRLGNNHQLSILGATEHNLKNIDIHIPLGKLVAITGVSGSGKSTLMSDILAKALSRHFYRAKAEPGKHREIKGLEHINKVIDIDQSPIGRTPRSNPATYTGAFTYIRDLFADLPEARTKHFGPGHFSFNVAGGRCEQCSGDGLIKVEMQFLSDVYLTCDVCGGERFQEKILAIKYKGKNIYDILNLTVAEALSFFTDQNALYQKLKTLDEVGLSYIKLGQPATTFSGGEAQRIKLATELARRATGQTLYILDEPTTGLHFADIERLLKVLNLLVDQGNTVLIIEHNLDVIKAVDWIIDLGPGGGDEGGQLVAAGTPLTIAQTKNSHTGHYLKKVLN